MTEAPAPRSLAWATELDVLPPDRVVERRDGYLVVRSPGNPRHHWGNFLLFDEAPGPGDGERWERAFAAELGHDPRIRHRVFGWDRADGDLGAAREEFGARGYDVEELLALVARPEEVRRHPRASGEVVVRALDAAPGADAALWDAVVDVQADARDERSDEEEYRAFARARLEGLRALFRLGRGAWYVAQDRASGAVAGSCGVVVAEGRGRFQAVDTAERFRRRGVASRLLADAAAHAAQAFGAERLVILAAADYHALALYESLGFERAEQVASVCRWPSR